MVRGVVALIYLGSSVFFFMTASVVFSAPSLIFSCADSGPPDERQECEPTNDVADRFQASSPCK